MKETIEHQPRERAVPCIACGVKPTRRGGLEPKTWTWNVSGLCSTHELALR